MVQGTIQTNYELIVTIDTATQGDRFATPRTQNVLLETRGGFADWFGITGTEIPPLDFGLLGMAGFEAQIISRIIDNVETWYADQAGVTVIVSTNPAEFAGETFTTIFLTNYNDGASSWGIASSLDPQNQNESNEALVFLPGFAQFVVPGQVDELADMLSRVVAHELGHTLGLRHAFNPGFGPTPIMGSGNQGAPPLPRQFVGDPDDPYATAMVLEEFFFGLQNEVDLLQLIFDVDT
jgi:predicted Zn-dependent protease